MSLLRPLLAEPLLRFCVLGGCLYALLQAFASPFSARTTHIDVTAEVLADYLQYQNKRFSRQEATQSLAQLTLAQQEQLIRDFVRDEALYREALGLGLDRNDEILRRRLIQKIEYVALGFSPTMGSISEAQLKDFYQQHKEDYRLAATVSFTHVFFNKTSNDGNPQAKAAQQLEWLNQHRVSFENAGQFGQRYLYHRNYVDRSDDYIRSHFGLAFQQALFQLSPSTSWQGPIASKQGWHLVLIKRASISYIPALSEVASEVLADAQRLQQQQAQAQAVESIVSKYTVSRYDRIE